MNTANTETPDTYNVMLGSLGLIESGGEAPVRFYQAMTPSKLRNLNSQPVNIESQAQSMSRHLLSSHVGDVRSGMPRCGTP